MSQGLANNLGVDVKGIFCAALLTVAIQSPTAIAKGPTGIGDLKLGLSKAQVEALGEASKSYAIEPMTPYVYKNGAEPKPGEDEYDVKLAAPFSDKPLKSVLTFVGGSLADIYVTLAMDGSDLDTVKQQITSRYGDPQVKDSMKEEQCVYRNGSNFKLSSGVVNYVWTEAGKNGQAVETRLTRTVLASCPSNLRYGSAEPLKLDSLSIGRPRKPKAESTDNAF